MRLSGRKDAKPTHEGTADSLDHTAQFRPVAKLADKVVRAAFRESLESALRRKKIQISPLEISGEIRFHTALNEKSNQWGNK